MKFTSVIAGFLAVYLMVTPCFASSHHADDTDAHAHGTHTHGDTDHHHSNDATEDQEHCCSELPLIAPSDTNVDIIGAAVLPSRINAITVNSVISIDLQLYAPRDGPIFERASQHAKTIVIRS